MNRPSRCHWRWLSGAKRYTILVPALPMRADCMVLFRVHSPRHVQGGAICISASTERSKPPASARTANRLPSALSSHAYCGQRVAEKDAPLPACAYAPGLKKGSSIKAYCYPKDFPVRRPSFDFSAVARVSLRGNGRPSNPIRRHNGRLQFGTI
jgi:hypothetical protein